MTRRGLWLRRAYQLFGLGLLLLGAVHMATTFRAFDVLSGAAVWFFGSGIAMTLAGALNSLNAQYGHAAAGLRWTCVATNVAMTGFAVAAGLATRAAAGEFVLILTLVGGAAVLSLLPGALAHPDPESARQAV
jgi:hypothetical protein